MVSSVRPWWLLGLLAACGQEVKPAARGPVGEEPYVRPVAPDPPTSTWLRVRAIDGMTGNTVPAKISLWRDGAPLTFARAEDPPECRGTGASLFELAPGGALGTWNGIALWRGDATIPIESYWVHRATFCNARPQRTGIPMGDYLVRVSRGPEYEIGEVQVSLRPNMGVVDVPVVLARAIDTRGYVAADLHIHSSPGSGDSSITAIDRVKTEVAVGVEVLVASDHDHHTDLGAALRALWPTAAFSPAVAIVGNEVTTAAGHFILAPQTLLAGQPRNGALAPASVPFHPVHFLPFFRALPENPFIQVAHPRLGFAAYFDSFACGPPGTTNGWTDITRPPGCPIDFDTLEVMSGTLACETKMRQQIEDWYALLRFGLVTTAVGSSDTHYESGILAGFPRSWVRIGSDDVAAFDQGQFVAALRRRAAVASTGPFATIGIGDAREGAFLPRSSDRITVSGRVDFPAWMAVDAVRLLVDGQPVKSWAIEGTRHFELRGEVELAADGFVNIEAQGKTPMPSWLVGDFVVNERLEDGKVACPNADGGTGVIPFVVTNPIFLDVDGDGLWKGKMLRE